MDNIKRIILFLPFPFAFLVLLFYPHSGIVGFVLFILLLSLTFTSYSFYKADINQKTCPWCGRRKDDHLNPVNFEACTEAENEKLLKFLNFINSKRVTVIFFFSLIVFLYIAKLILNFYSDTSLLIKIIQFTLLCLTGFVFIFFSSLYNRYSADKGDDIKLPSFASILLLPGINIGLWALKICGVIILIIASDGILPLMSQILVAIF